MSTKDNPLVAPIKGYFITITNQNVPDGHVILEQELRLGKVGGAHVNGVADLIMQIEDAVFTEEQEQNGECTY